MAYGREYGSHRQPDAVGQNHSYPRSGQSVADKSRMREGSRARHSAWNQPIEAASSSSLAEANNAEWPLLADDMFRLAHRDSDGVSLLDERMSGLALSAALLGELLLSGRLAVRSGLVVVLDTTPPPDLLAHTVLDQVTSERDSHLVRTWLAYIGRSAHHEVAGRMERAGHVQTQIARRLLSRTVRYVPKDMNTAAWPWVRLTEILRGSHSLDEFDVLLGGLAVATDLHRVVLVGDAGAFAHAFRPILAGAASSVRELVAHTRAAAGDAVITRP